MARHLHTLIVLLPFIGLGCAMSATDVGTVGDDGYESTGQGAAAGAGAIGGSAPAPPPAAGGTTGGTGAGGSGNAAGGGASPPASGGSGSGGSAGASSGGSGGLPGLPGTGGTAGAPAPFGGTGGLPFPFPAPPPASDAGATEAGTCDNAVCFDVFDCVIWHLDKTACGFTKCEAFVCK